VPEPRGWGELVNDESPPARILVVDDHALGRKLLERILEREGYAVESAVSIDAAVRAASLRSFDLVILDLHLGDGSGLELAHVLRRLPGMRRIPLVACTATAAEVGRRRAFEAGCEAYVVKPIDTTEFAALVYSLLFDPRALRARRPLRAS
jgi:CheY-like chemotaxis protein